MTQPQIVIVNWLTELQPIKLPDLKTDLNRILEEIEVCRMFLIHLKNISRT